jgi:hypothetical protein
MSSHAQTGHKPRATAPRGAARYVSYYYYAARAETD